jgi:putative ABC transport system substrate-binding protein
MRRLIVLVILCCGFSNDVLAAESRYTVLMLLYRGVTEAEKGFMEYLKPRLPVDFVIRDAGGDRARIREFVEEAKQMRPHLIYAFGTTVALDTVGVAGKVDPKRHIADIPVVFNIVADPVGAGLARGFVATGRNLTGVSHLVPMPLQLKTMQRLKKVQRLGVIYNPHEANAVLSIRELRQYAGEFGFKLIEAPLDTSSGQKVDTRDVESALRKLIESRPDFIYLPSDSSLIQQASSIVDAATAAKVPVISATEAPIRKQGAYMGMVSSYYNAGAYAGYKAEQILSGKQVIGNIPIDTLQRFTLLVNMNTGGKLELYPPLDLIPIAELLR